MARVNISRQLISDVVGVMRRMCRQELDQAPAPTKRCISGKDEEHVKLVWGEYYPLKATTPIEWCIPCDSNTTFHIKVAHTDEEGTLANFTVRVDLMDEMYAPPNRDSSKYNHYVRDIKPYGDLPDVFKAVLDADFVQNEIRSRWDRVAEQVTQYLNASPSLNKAVELWPELALYIPEQYKQKMAEKVTRSKVDTSRAEDCLKQINVGEVIAAGVTAKMMGGAV